MTFWSRYLPVKGLVNLQEGSIFNIRQSTVLYDSRFNTGSIQKRKINKGHIVRESYQKTASFGGDGFYDATAGYHSDYSQYPPGKVILLYIE